MNFLVDITYAVLDPRQRSPMRSVIASKTSTLGYLKMAGMLTGVVAVLGWLIKIGLSYTKTVGDWFSSTHDSNSWSIPVLTATWIGVGVWLFVIYRRAMDAKGKSGTPPLLESIQRIAKHKAAYISVIILYFMVLTCVAGPWIFEMMTDIDYQDQDRTHAWLRRSWRGWAPRKWRAGRTCSGRTHSVAICWRGRWWVDECRSRSRSLRSS
jgi:hypothetical protein